MYVVYMYNLVLREIFFYLITFDYQVFKLTFRWVLKTYINHSLSKKHEYQLTYLSIKNLSENKI